MRLVGNCCAHQPKPVRTGIDRKGGRAFVEDMQAYFAEENPIERDGIAVRQLRGLREHQGPRDKKPWLSDVKEMFLEMKKISRVK
jgi:hypothetical protein